MYKPKKKEEKMKPLDETQSDRKARLKKKVDKQSLKNVVSEIGQFAKRDVENFYFILLKGVIMRNRNELNE